MLISLLSTALLLWGVMSIAWFAVVKTGHASIVDVAWTIGLGLAGLLLCGLVGEMTARQSCVGGMVLLWSVRLAVALSRRAIGHPEDARYTALRQQWGAAFHRRLYGFLLLQAVAAEALLISVAAAASVRAPLHSSDIIALCVMLVALAGGTCADEQMRRFKQHPENIGKICDVGLWSRSRHPNYVCEVLFWCGYPLLAWSGGWSAFVVGVSGPLLIYWFLRYVSGVPPLEAHLQRRYGALFEQYCRQTPIFFPRLF